jgi:hypothetical protein
MTCKLVKADPVRGASPLGHTALGQCHGQVVLLPTQCQEPGASVAQCVEGYSLLAQSALYGRAQSGGAQEPFVA